MNKKTLWQIAVSLSTSVAYHDVRTKEYMIPMSSIVAILSSHCDESYIRLDGNVLTLTDRNHDEK